MMIITIVTIVIIIIIIGDLFTRENERVKMRLKI